MADKETEVQAAICDYLALRKHFFVRLNNIPGLYIDATGNKRFRKMGKYARPGLADILVIRSGQAAFIEVQREKGKPWEEQGDFGRDAILAGAMSLVARSIDDVQKIGLGTASTSYTH